MKKVFYIDQQNEDSNDDYRLPSKPLFKLELLDFNDYVNDPFFENLNTKSKSNNENENHSDSSASLSNQCPFENKESQSNTCLEMDVRIKGEFRDDLFRTYIGELINQVWIDYRLEKLIKDTSQRMQKLENQRKKSIIEVKD